MAARFLGAAFPEADLSPVQCRGGRTAIDDAYLINAAMGVFLAGDRNSLLSRGPRGDQEGVALSRRTMHPFARGKSAFRTHDAERASAAIIDGGQFPAHRLRREVGQFVLRASHLDAPTMSWR